MSTVILDTSKTVADGNTIFKYMNYVVATDLEVHFFSSTEGGANTFVYIVYVQVIDVW